MIKAGSTLVHDGSSFQVSLQSRRDHLWFHFIKGDQKATEGESMYGDSTIEMDLSTQGGRAAILQTRRNWAGARDVNAEFQEDAAAQYLRLY